MTITVESILPTEYNDARLQLIGSAPMSEASLLGNVRRLCRLYGLLCYHTQDSRGSEPGFPDLEILSSNRNKRGILYRELKVNGRPLTLEQKRWARQLQENGGDYEVWTPEDYASRRITCQLARFSQLAAIGQLPVPPDVEQLRLDEAA